MASSFAGLVPLAFSHSSGIPSPSLSAGLPKLVSFHAVGAPIGSWASDEMMPPSVPKDRT